MMRWLGLVVISVTLLGVGAAAVGASEGSIATRPFTIANVPEDQRSTPLLIDELDPQTVLLVSAHGFDGSVTGRVQQCVDGEVRRCANQLRVRFDERGSTVFQYLVADDFADGSAGCRLAGPRCTLDLIVGRDTTTVDTVFVDAAPSPGTISMSPSQDLRDGDMVSIRVQGFAPSTEFEIAVCARPATRGPRCGTPGISVGVVTDEHGSAVIETPLDVHTVGAEGVACARRTPCQIVVISDGISARARPLPLDLASGRQVAYNTTRLLVALATAALLLGGAAWLILSTDWKPHLESRAALIDDAEYADLDKEAQEFIDGPR